MFSKKNFLLFLYSLLTILSSVFFFKTAIIKETKIEILSLINFPPIIIALISIVVYIHIWVYFGMELNKEQGKFRIWHNKIFQTAMGIAISIAIFNGTYSISPSIASYSAPANNILEESMSSIMSEADGLSENIDFVNFQKFTSEGNLERENMNLKVFLSEEFEKSIKDAVENHQYKEFPAYFKDNLKTNETINDKKEVITSAGISQYLFENYNSLSFSAEINGNPGDCFNLRTIVTTSTTDPSNKKSAYQFQAPKLHDQTNDKEFCVKPEQKNRLIIHSNVSHLNSLGNFTQNIDFVLTPKEGTDAKLYVNQFKGEGESTTSTVTNKSFISNGEFRLTGYRKNYEKGPIFKSDNIFCLQGNHKGNPDEYLHIDSDEKTKIKLGKCNYNGKNMGYYSDNLS